MNRTLMITLTLGFVATLALSQTSAPKKSPPKTAETIRGIVISCPGYGPEWGTDAMVKDMRGLKDLGVNAIQIHPYASIRKNGRVGNRSFKDAKNPPTWITRPIAEAKKLGLRFMMKPHLAYWGSGFSWRGEIVFATEEEWTQFFSSYEDWIVKMAIMSKGAESFCIGTELDRTLHRKKEWLRVIAAVRKVYSGHLTYAANWSDVERVPFWDQLDSIGIQGYYPVLAGKYDTKNPPSRATLDAGWARIAKNLEAMSKKAGKPIILAELGYNQSSNAPFEPWRYEREGRQWNALQALCLESALSAIEKSKAIRGSYLWKWFPGRRTPRDFNLEAKHMKKAMKNIWAKKRRTTTPKPATESKPG